MFLVLPTMSAANLLIVLVLPGLPLRTSCSRWALARCRSILTTAEHRHSRQRMRACMLTAYGVPLATTTETAESSAVDRCSIQRQRYRSRGRAEGHIAYPCVRGWTVAQRMQALASVLCRSMPASSHGHRTEPAQHMTSTGRTASCNRGSGVPFCSAAATCCASATASGDC